MTGRYGNFQRHYHQHIHLLGPPPQWKALGDIPKSEAWDAEPDIGTMLDELDFAENV
jgi:hypothetical protein